MLTTMDWLNSFLTVLSLILFLSVSISSLSPRWDYRVKITYVYISYMLASLFMIPYGLIVRTPMKVSLLAGILLSPVSKLLGLKWTIKGSENIDRKRAYVVICNHQSALDVLATSKIWPLFDKCVIVAKKELMYAGPFGLAITLCGTVFVDRASSTEGRKAINEAGKMAKTSGTSMFLFPEGTRHRGGGGQLLAFKKGAFHVAVDSKLPILPVVISEYEFLGPSRRDHFTGGEVTIQVLPPVETEGVAKEQIDDLIKETRDAMLEALNSLKH